MSLCMHSHLQPSMTVSGGRRAHSRKLTVRPNKAHVLRTRINTTFWTPDAVVQLVPQGPATFRKTATSRPSGLRQPASLAFGTSE